MQKAVLVHQHKGLAHNYFCELAEPKPQFGELKVRVLAVGLNHMDIWARIGIEGFKFPLPLIPGCDLVAEVDELGEGCSTNISKGQRVIVSAGYGCSRCEYCVRGEVFYCKHFGLLGENRNGTEQEYICLPESFFYPINKSVPLEVAATLGVVHTTAYEMLVSKAKVKPGEKVLVIGASAGVGYAAIQIAKLFGAEVYALSSSEEKRKALELEGANYTLDSGDPKWYKSAKEALKGDLFDVVIDHVGGEFLEKSMGLLKPGKSLITCGATLSKDVNLNVTRLFFRSLKIQGSTMGNPADLFKIIDFFEKGKLKQRVSHYESWEKLPELLEELYNRKVLGKAVIKIH